MTKEIEALTNESAEKDAALVEATETIEALRSGHDSAERHARECERKLKKTVHAARKELTTCTACTKFLV